MKKRLLGVLLSATMITGLVAGCGGKPQVVTSTPTATAKTEDPQKTEQVTELKLFGFKTGAEEGAIPTLIEKFNSENPTIKVTYEGISNAGGYQDVLTSRLASGQGDDIFLANPNYLAQFQEAGYVEDLSSMPVVNEYSPLVKDLLTINNTIPGLGMEVAVFGLYSNMDLLKEVGIEKAPDNYDEFLKDCELLKAAGKTPVVAGSKDGTGVAVFAFAKGLDQVYTATDKLQQFDKMNKGEILFGDVVKPGFEVVKDLMDKGYLDGNQSLVYAAGQDDIAEFAKGNIGFMPGGSWFVAGINKAAPNMNVSLGGIPVQKEDSLIMINAGVRVCINSASQNKDAAKKFVEFFTSLESVNDYVASQNSFNPLAKGTSAENPVVAAAAERLTAARMVPWVDSAFNGAVVSPWADVRTFATHIAGGASIDETVAGLNTQVQNNLQLAKGAK